MEATYPAPTAPLRIDRENPNHHLWCNNGTWFLSYTVHPTPFTKERVRLSLGTRDVNVARQHRDTIFAQLSGSPALDLPTGA